MNVSELKGVLINVKRLSGMISSSDYLLNYNQSIEKDLLRIISVEEDWKRSDLELLEEKGVIDAYDKGFLKRILPR